MANKHYIERLTLTVEHVHAQLPRFLAYQSEQDWNRADLGESYSPLYREIFCAGSSVGEDDHERELWRNAA